MLPPNAIVRGALTWLRLLQNSSLSSSALILRADAHYADLTQGQYAAALELLKQIGALYTNVNSNSWVLSEEFKDAAVARTGQILFEKIIEHAAPAWLPDADILIPDPGEMPEDAAKLGNALGLQDQACFWSVRNVHRRIDLARRKLVGDAGELGLLQLLESNWPGSTEHVASIGDGYGFDIAFQHNQREWHLEVKSTTRRGRMTVYLSRNEYEVSLKDPYWRLIVVGLDANLQLKAFATLSPGHLAAAAPADRSAESKWQSASYDVARSALTNGLCLSEQPPGAVPASRQALCLSGGGSAWFDWMPAG
jgi:hypothetical protein